MSAPVSESAPQNSSGELTQEQAVARQLAREQSARAPKQRAPDPTEPDPDDEDEAELELELDDPDEGNAHVEGDEFEDEAELEDGDDEPSRADPVVKFDDGTELPLSEVKRGFLRQQDYTRKTQEAAEARRAVEAERQAYLAEKKAVSDRIGPLVQQAIAIINNPDTQAELAQLRLDDPGAYAVKVMELQQRKAAVEQLEQQQRMLREQAEQEELQRAQRETQEIAERSRASLMQKFPEAKKDFAPWYQRLGKYAVENGVPPELWDAEVNDWAITFVEKARLYDRAIAKTPAMKDRLRRAPQPMRPGSPQAPGHAQARVIREATERAAKSGSFDDAVALQLLKEKARRRAR